MTLSDDLALEAALEGVDGWLHLDEAHELVRAVLDQPPGGPLSVVEIGSWKGRSTVALALAARQRGDAVVTAIDPHLGDNGEWAQESDTYEAFLRNVSVAGLDDMVRPIRKFSHEARADVDDGSVGVLFVDGSHRYEDVRRDIEDWVPTLTEGAIIAFNDSSKPGVYRALSEQILECDSRFRSHRLVRSTLFLRYSTSPLTDQERRDLRRLRIVLRIRRAAHPMVRALPGPVKRMGNQISVRVGRG
jgi:predicted O-methyltransferase YrrM